jgi:hypothetical protein
MGAGLDNLQKRQQRWAQPAWQQQQQSPILPLLPWVQQRQQPGRRKWMAFQQLVVQQPAVWPCCSHCQLTSQSWKWRQHAAGRNGSGRCSSTAREDSSRNNRRAASTSKSRCDSGAPCHAAAARRVRVALVRRRRPATRADTVTWKPAASLAEWKIRDCNSPTQIATVKFMHTTADLPLLHNVHVMHTYMCLYRRVYNSVQSFVELEVSQRRARGAAPSPPAAGAV